MPITTNLGELEQLILLAIIRLGSDAYGVTIRGELAERAGRKISPGAVYTSLERLERKGFIVSRMGDPLPQRGGRSRRYVTVTSTGLETLKRSVQTYERMLDGLDHLRGAHA